MLKQTVSVFGKITKSQLVKYFKKRKGTGLNLKKIFYVNSESHKD